MIQVPTFDSFVAPYLSVLRESLDGPTGRYDSFRSPEDWLESMLYENAPALVRLHRLYAEYLAVDLDASRPDELHFSDWACLISHRLFGDGTPAPTGKNERRDKSFEASRQNDSATRATRDV